MGRRKTVKPGDWTTVRVRPEWLDMLRSAHKQDPTFSPNVDLKTASAPHLLHVACQVASLVISGWIWDRLTPDIDRLVDKVRLDAVIRVAAHFGATVQTNADGSLTVNAPGKDMPNATIPPAQPFERPMTFH